MFIKIINNNLSKSEAMNNRKTHVIQKSGNNGPLINNSEWQYAARENKNYREKMQRSEEKLNLKNENYGLQNLRVIANICQLNGRSRKYLELQDYLGFWNLSYDSNDTTSSDIILLSAINRNCIMKQAPMFCCSETSDNLELSGENKNLCSSFSQGFSHCREFCINMNPDEHLINYMEYKCQGESEDQKKLFKSTKKSQTVVFNKTSAIITGKEDAKNAKFQLWAQEMIQNLDTALAQQSNSTDFKLTQDSKNNSVLLSQWIEFPDSVKAPTNQKGVGQLLQDYQEYDENLSNNLIRICITNQDKPAIVCTEKHHNSMCLLDDPDGCIDNMLTVQMSIICRHFNVENAEIIEVRQIPCDSLDETMIFWNFLHEKSKNRSILLLQFTRIKVFQPIPEEEIGAETNKNMKHIHRKYASGIKLKNEGRIGISKFKVIKPQSFKDTTTTVVPINTSAVNKSGFSIDKGGSHGRTIDFRNLNMPGAVFENYTLPAVNYRNLGITPSVPESSATVNNTVGSTTGVAKTGFKITAKGTSPDNFQISTMAETLNQIDGTVKNATSNSSNVDEYNVIAELEVQTING